MEFVVRTLKDKPDVLEVRYECACGCKPRARYTRGSDEAGHEHCCCGRVHFVGGTAKQQLEAYIAQRRTSGEDTRHYALAQYQVSAPWGQVPVAFGTPETITHH